tara:strand:- start:147 stop:380 length:234 start_codon:yes stop_codon:yes gene_type:complete
METASPEIKMAEGLSCYLNLSIIAKSLGTIYYAKRVIGKVLFGVNLNGQTDPAMNLFHGNPVHDLIRERLMNTTIHV